MRIRKRLNVVHLQEFEGLEPQNTSLDLLWLKLASFMPHNSEHANWGSRNKQPATLELHKARVISIFVLIWNPVNKTCVNEYKTRDCIEAIRVESVQEFHVRFVHNIFYSVFSCSQDVKVTYQKNANLNLLDVVQ